MSRSLPYSAQRRASQLEQIGRSQLVRIREGERLSRLQLRDLGDLQDGVRAIRDSCEGALRQPRRGGGHRGDRHELTAVEAHVFTLLDAERRQQWLAGDDDVEVRTPGPVPGRLRRRPSSTLARHLPGRPVRTPPRRRRSHERLEAMISYGAHRQLGYCAAHVRDSPRPRPPAGPRRLQQVAVELAPGRAGRRLLGQHRCTPPAAAGVLARV